MRAVLSERLAPRALLRSLVTGAAGVLGSAAFAPLEWWPALPLSLAIYFAAVSGTFSWRAWQGFAYGLGFFVPLLHWSGTYVGAFPWLALAVFQSLFLVPIALLLPRIYLARSPWLVATTVASLWLFLEAVRSRIPWGGFGWGRLAFGQVDAPWVGVVQLGGAPLLGFVTVILAIMIARRFWNQLVVVAIGALLLGMFLMGIGQVAEVGSLNVSAVQGNVPRLGLDFNAQRAAVLRNHIEATAGVPATADVIVWPENASDIDPLTDPAIRAEIDQLVSAKGMPLILGAVLRTDGRLQNASILWDPTKGAGPIYVKRRLAPFGEFMPLRSLAEALVPEARRVEDFIPGKTVTLFPIRKHVIGALICFEVLYDDLGRDLVRSGANVLITQTNSATFGTSPESAQQLQITRLRAIEHHRAIASVSTSGISAMINERGQVITKSTFFAQTVLTTRLRTFQGATPADRIGAWSEFALITLPLMLLWWKRR